MTSTRARIVAVLAAIALIATGILVPTIASAAPTYPAQAPGSISLTQVDTSQISFDTGDFPAGTTVAAKVQWYRGSKAITGKTANVLTLSSADQNQLMKVLVTVSVPGFAPTSRFSNAGNFSFTRSGSFSITGSPQVGTSLTGADAMTFKDPSGNPQSPDRFYQWLVNGVVSGSELYNDPGTFPVLPAHMGKKIALRVTVVNFGIAPQVFSTAALTITLKTPIAQTGAGLDVFKTTNPDGTFLLTAAPTGAVTEPDVVGPSFQWYRQVYPAGAITAISGKTAQTYTPTAADYPYRIFAKATYTKTGYQPLVLTSFAQDYSVRIQDLGFSSVPKVGNDVLALWYASIADNGSTDRNGVNGTVAKSFVWSRAGVLIPSVTTDTYPVGVSDVGKSMSFTVTASLSGYLPAVKVKSPTSAKAIVGTLSFGGATGPTFTVSSTGLLTATTGSPPYPTDATVTKYQWLRSGVAIPKATGASYQLVAADFGKPLQVVLTYSRPGYANSTMTSENRSHWIDASPQVPLIAGTPVPGSTVGVDARTYTDAHTGNTILPDSTIVNWKINGVVVSTDPTYVIKPADRGKTLSVTVTARESGLLQNVSTSNGVVVGDLPLENWDAQPGVAVTTEGGFGPLVLRAGSTGITGPAGLVVKRQWFRGTAAITGAVSETFTPTAADRGQKIWVRVTTTHAPVAGQSYASNVKESVPQDYTLAVGPGVIQHPSGFSVGDEIYLYIDPFPSGAGRTITWLRNGVAISGAPSDTYYTLQPADLGARISVRVLWTKPGYLGLTATYTTSPPTDKVTAGTFDPGSVVPEVVPNGNGKLKVTVPAGVAPTPTSYAYQWLRDGVAITKQTLATYTLAAPDAGRDITVRVTPAMKGYTSTPLPLPAAHDYAIVPSAAPALPTGTLRIGEEISPVLPSYSSELSSVLSVFTSIRWLRNGAFTGKTTPTYTLGTADLNTSIQAQVTVVTEGHLALVHTSPGTSTISKGHTSVDPTALVTFDDATQTLRASITGMVPASPAPAMTYQWLRDGNPISKATSSSYKPVAADVLADLSVRISVNRGSTFDNTIAPVTSVPKSYRIIRGTGSVSVPPVITGTLRVGEVLSVTPESYYDEQPTLLSATEKFTWMRNGAVISGQTAGAYVLQAADLNQTITVKVTTSAPGHLTTVSVVSAGVVPTQKGIIAGSFADAVITMPTAGTLKADLASGSITTPAPLTLTYQWYRNSAPISNAKGQTYKLTSAETATLVSVRITVGKIGYDTLVDAVFGVGNVLSAGANVPTIVSDGSVITATPPAFTAPGVTNAGQYTVEYLWLRDGVSTTGYTTNPQYTITGADSGTTITVQVRGIKPFYYYGLSGASAGILVP